MNNTITLEQPLRRRLRLAVFILLIFTVVFAGILLLLRAISVKNYSGQVTEVTGQVQHVNYDEDEDSYEIVINNVGYNANTVARFSDDLDLQALVNQQVTLYITQTQVGNVPWVLGLKQGEQLLVDYEQVIALGSAENRNMMIIFGVCAGVFLLAACGVYIWRLNTPQTKEYNLAQKYSEYSMARQPSCPEYRKFFFVLLIYFVVVIGCTTTIGIVCDNVENETVQIAVGASFGSIAALSTVGLLLLLPLWLFKKEREFYAKNFPFDFTDVSHVQMRKQFKEQLQAELNAERAMHPHRYGDGGNGYTVEFSEEGLKFYSFDARYAENAPSTEDVFGVQDSERDARCYLCTVDYQTLNFEALPFYSKTHHPLTVVIKSRLNVAALPDELKPSGDETRNDVHIVLDSNLLATLRHFNVSVENLQYILDNKEQLIAENCVVKLNKKSK